MRTNRVSLALAFAVLTFGMACGTAGTPTAANPASSSGATDQLVRGPTAPNTTAGQTAQPAQDAPPQSKPSQVQTPESDLPQAQPTQIQSTEIDREQALRQANHDVIAALTTSDLAQMYTYFHTDFKVRCPFNDFAALILLARSFLGGDVTEVEFRTQSVALEGNKGYVKGDIYVNGRPTGLGNVDVGYWIWEEGKWWLTNDDPKPCALSLSPQTPRR